MAFLERHLPRLLCRRFALALLSLIAMAAPLQVRARATDYQVEAVFLLNFTRFVDWPPGTFANAQQPLVIGVLGDDPFGSFIDQTMMGEKVSNRSVVVKRFRNADDFGACQILFVSQSEAGHLEHIMARLRDRSVLTVSDIDGFTERGGIIGFIPDNDRIKLGVNVDAAKAANVTISSKLLRIAQITTRATSAIAANAPVLFAAVEERR